MYFSSLRGGTASSERWRRTSGRVTHRGETTRFLRLDFGSWLAKFLYHADSLATLAKKIKLEQCVYTCDGVVDRFRTDWLSFLWLWTLIVPFWSCLRRHFTLDLFTPLVCASSWLENFCEFILSLLSSHGTNKSMQQLNNCEFRTQLFLSFFLLIMRVQACFLGQTRIILQSHTNCYSLASDSTTRWRHENGKCRVREKGSEPGTYKTVLGLELQIYIYFMFAVCVVRIWIEFRLF